MTEILTEIDFVHYRHLNGGKGFRTPYILEYKDDQNNVSFYTECPDDKKENRLTNLLVSLVDPDYVDMVVSSDWQKGVRAPTYPGGEKALSTFVKNAVRYPTDALRDLVEYTVNVEFIVEKDGSIGMIRDVSWPKLEMDYGFADEAIRVVKSMPKWTPATKNGKTVRCYANVSYKFVLPKNIRPQYGHPVLETQRDRRRWEDIEACHRKLLQNPLDEKATLWMGKYYYWEYILEHEPVKTPTDMDSLFNENNWENFYDRSPVVSHPGDSALKYFYKVLEMNPDTEIITEIYMPVLQLEQQLDRSHNPLAELPYDTVEGIHFPCSYFINWPEDGRLDASKDYYMDAWDSFFWVNFFSKYLTKMQEPVIYNNKLQEDEVIFRFSLFPSFDPPVVFRVMKNKQNVTLYWKIIITEIDPKTGNVISYSVKEGHKPMTASQYEQLLRYMEEVRLDELPHSDFAMMLDGAQWVVERVTDHGFKAYATNVPKDSVRWVFSFLAKLSGQKIEYMEKY
ncbi:MAG: energy transducer TonB [Bacteroidales bacterium]|nr:energy transducer TonB [Bacteroidales bacterium]